LTWLLLPQLIAANSQSSGSSRQSKSQRRVGGSPRTSCWEVRQRFCRRNLKNAFRIFVL